MDISAFLASNLPAIAPEIGLTILAVVILLLDSYLPGDRRNIAYVAAIGMAVLAITPFVWSPGVAGACVDCWGGMIRHDIMAQVFKVMVLFAGAITCLMAVNDSHVGQKGEFYLIITICTVGGCLMAGASDLIMLFIALETVSIPLYVLAGFRRTDERSSESGMKYFLFGSFASAMLLYGLSLLYGFTGSTNLSLIAEALASADVASETGIIPVLGALTLVVVGFGFKISAAPFHFWTPDVYEGAPTPVTGFVSVASKAASFALLMRFFMSAFPAAVVVDNQSIQLFWANLIAIVAIISMTLGNILALRQSNMKRMLAYSSIAQAGYALIGVASLQSIDPVTASVSTETLYAVSSVSFYMFMYTFSNLLVFAGVILFSEAAGTEEISEYAGMQRRSPWLAMVMTIGLLSLAGIPPAAGFVGKFFLFQAAVESGLVGLAIIGVLNSIIALYYYLVVIKIMWVDPGPDEDVQVVIPRPMAWTFGITSIVVILLGVLPAAVIDWAREGAISVAQAMISGL